MLQKGDILYIFICYLLLFSNKENSGLKDQKKRVINIFSCLAPLIRNRSLVPSSVFFSIMVSSQACQGFFMICYKSQPTTTHKIFVNQ